MKTLRTLIGGAALLALGAFAFAPPADARAVGYDRHGHHPHHRHHHRHYPRGPRVSLGLTFPVLPHGFVNLSVGGRPFFYQGGHYYRHGPSGYVVVAAPLGASVVSLPASAVRVQIGGALFYQYGSAYYQWQPATSTYVVVPPPAGAPVAVATPSPAVSAAPSSGPYSGEGYAPGEVLEELPAGYAAEVINGVQYYRYGGNYFMPTQRDGREVYVVVRI